MTLKMDGFDDCIVGFGHRCSQVPLLVYDRNKVLAKLQERGMDEDEAEEFYEFNIASAWAGEGTPLLLQVTTPEEALAALEDDSDD